MIFSVRRPQYFISHTTSQRLLVTRHRLSCEKVNLHNTLVTLRGPWFLQLRTGLTYSLAAFAEDSLKTGAPKGGFLLNTLKH